MLLFVCKSTFFFWGGGGGGGGGVCFPKKDIKTITWPGSTLALPPECVITVSLHLLVISMGSLLRSL